MPWPATVLVYPGTCLSRAPTSLRGSVQLHVIDRKAFRPATVDLHLIATARGLYPDEFAWREGGG
jgi:uncharacterized protein YbbC (DUF1343 family)